MTSIEWPNDELMKYKLSNLCFYRLLFVYSEKTEFILVVTYFFSHKLATNYYYKYLNLIEWLSYVYIIYYTVAL